MEKLQADRACGDGAMVLSHAAETHLRAAFRQMDLLLQSRQADAGLAHLVALLEHLRAFRQAIA